MFPAVYKPHLASVPFGLPWFQGNLGLSSPLCVYRPGRVLLPTPPLHPFSSCEIPFSSPFVTGSFLDALKRGFTFCFLGVVCQEYFRFHSPPEHGLEQLAVPFFVTPCKRRSFTILHCSFSIPTLGEQILPSRTYLTSRQQSPATLFFDTLAHLSLVTTLCSRSLPFPSGRCFFLETGFRANRF